MWLCMLEIFARRCSSQIISPLVRWSSFFELLRTFGLRTFGSNSLGFYCIRKLALFTRGWSAYYALGSTYIHIWRRVWGYMDGHGLVTCVDDLAFFWTLGIILWLSGWSAWPQRHMDKFYWWSDGSLLHTYPWFDGCPLYHMVWWAFGGYGGPLDMLHTSSTLALGLVGSCTYVE